jgi:hypothetical protein
MAKPRSKPKSVEIKNIKAANAAYYKALSARDGKGVDLRSRQHVNRPTL